MKFSHQLKFNTVPEWKEKYIHYAALKKLVYQIAKEQTTESQPGYEDGDHAVAHPLLHPTEKAEITEEFLIKSLDRELADVIKFYMAQEAETLGKLEQLDLEIHSLEHHRLTSPGDSLANFRAFSMPPEGAHNAAAAALASAGSAGMVDLEAVANEANRASRIEFWRMGGRSMPKAAPVRALPAKDTSKLKQRIIELFVSLHDLKDFLQINKEGFRKLLKKHDKVTQGNLKDRYWRVVEEKYPSKKAEVLDQALNRIVDQFAVLYCNGDVEKAKETLNKTLREQIKVERNTVWKDMIAMERRHTAAVVVKPGAEDIKRVSWVAAHKKTLSLLASCMAFATLLCVDIFPEPEKQNCLALLTFVSMLWASEAIPLFATSMLVAPLVVLLKVLVDRTLDQPMRMSAQQAAPAIFHAMFSQTIMLLLGGFAIASALSKHFIAKQMAVAVLSRVGRKPRNVLLASMFVATFASMWISNVAAPVLCFSIMGPILKTLDVTSPFAKALVMGIALASNVGGMTSPISSPQNIFAIERMSMDGQPPSWLSWFAVSLPVSIVCNLLCWLLILVVYQPWRSITDVRPLKPNTDPINFTQVYVIVVSLVTVGLWCANTALQPITGEMGVVAVLPLIAFFGFGILSKDDFNSFLWNVVMLAMGGLALGEAVKSSGLLQSIAEAIQEVTNGMDLYQVLVVFCLTVLVCTTFISHTVGAMVILPIVQKVGEDMPSPHPKLLIMASALMCSGAMGLPVSGFPNMNAVSLEDDTGESYVGANDFIKVGVPGSILAFFVVISLGYFLMLLVRF